MSAARAVRTAVILAAGFVLVRVLYRVVFGGAGGSGPVLLDLPRIRLSGPFEYITLLGPVTLGGVTSAAVSALPFAALILAMGLVAAVVDLRALLTRGALRGPLRTVCRALVVAWATFPALLAAVRRVRRGRELRGDSGARSLIVPVLEHTVELAVALGASMEVRGFGASKPEQPRCDRPVVMRDAALGYDGRWSLEHIELDLAPGTLAVVTGPTGSGKSTLLSALSGLFQHSAAGDQRGVIEVAGVDRLSVTPRETAGFVGVVSQSPRRSFVAPTVAEELGFSLAIRSVAPVIVAARVDEVAGRLGIRHLLTREVATLSAGEACLVAIGAALAEHPVLLVVDEPLADLDGAARDRVIEVLDRLAHEAGICVLVAEHSVDGWADRPDRWLALRAGTVIELPRAPTEPAAPSPDRQRVVGGPPAATVAVVDRLSVRHDDVVAVAEASFNLKAGEIVALTGPNGAGKSSLLDALARPTDPGHVLVAGRDVLTLRRRARRAAIALVPEDVDDLLSATTVEGECRRADRLARTSGTAEMFLGLLGATDPEGGARGRALLDRHPRDLSAGERLCLAIALQLSERPAVLLIDEPSRGLDASARALVAAALRSAAAAGTAVLLATHDRAFAATCASRTLTMDAGVLHVEAVVTR